ncbi:hypothetical protein MACH16_26730 [Marinomonas pontica]|uniref:Secretin/TonB short N-terminal domain-containing protein n=1 Tax=Marinomonas pontica TaxID=264739 RepID=A0ABM8FFT4_9GAMM|nr:hypothetical protein MACH16_26730 [Marinomonas pontica]
MHVLKRRSALTLLSASIAFASGVAVPSFVYAEVSSVSVRYYDVPAGALAQALNTFAAMSGVYLGGSAELLSGKRTLGFKGEYSTTQALDLLLLGTGLSYVQGKGNSVVLIDPNAVSTDENGITMSPLLVESGRSTTTLGKNVLSSSEIESMAGDTSNLTDLLKGNGAVRFSRSSSTSASSASMRPDEVSIHGQSHYQNSYVIDGMSANNDLNPGDSEDTYSNPISPTNLSMLSGSSSQSYYVDPDALESVTVYDSNVPVEFGGFLGGVISSTLKRYDGEDYLSVKYAISKDEWDEMHADEDLEEDLADGDSIEGEYTPEYLKQRLTLTGAQGITDKLGMTFTASRATSAFDQSYVKNIGNTVYGKQGVEYDDTVDNAMARFDYKASQNLDVGVSMLYGFWPEDFDQIRQKVTDIAKRNKDAAKNRGTIWSIKMVEAVTSDKVLPDPQQSNDRILRLVDSISLADVNARLRQWLSSPDRILYTQAVGGKAVNIGSVESIDDIFQEMESRPLAALQTEHVVAAKTLPEVTQKGTVTLTSRNVELGVSRWSLSNGDFLTLLDPTVLAERYQIEASGEGTKSYFTAVSAAGYHVKQGSTWAEQIAVQMSEATGVYGWSDDEFQQWRKDNKVSLSSKQKAQNLVYRASIDDEKIESLLGLYHVNQVTPHIDHDVYDTVMASLKRNASVDVVRPIEAFSRRIAKARFESNNVTLTVADLAPLSLEKLEQTRQKQVALPVQYFIVSRLPESDITALVEQYLATVPRDLSASKLSQSALVNDETTPVLQLAGNRVVDLSLNTEPKAEYRFYAYQAVPWSPSAALQLTYLGERLETMLKQRLRSEVQGVYSVRVGLELNKETNRAELSIQYSSAPARLDDLATMTTDVLAQWPSMVTAEWASEIQEAFADVEQNRLANDFDGTLSHRLELSERFYGNAQYLNDMDELSLALSEAKLNAFVEHLSFNDRVIGFFRPKE